MPPPPREAPTTPEQAQVNAMAVVLGPKPVDSNGNLKPDTIQIEAYLFSRPYPTPTWREGSFEFAIYPTGKAGTSEQPKADPIRSWSISAERAAGMRTRSIIGQGYSLSLSLLDNGGTDQIGFQSVDLLARFVPTDGAPVVNANGVRSVSLASPVVPPGR